MIEPMTHRTPQPHGGGLQGFITRWLARLHRDEGGAVAVMCLAATLIVFMVGLIVYDTGKITRSKLDAQMAADTAAYSQAAVKARSMNMAAFSNVGKRTVVGIRNMYYFQYPAYVSWVSGQCSRCCCGWFCGCWGACFNCFGNIPVLLAELPDWIAFAFSRNLGNDSITKHLSALDTFQSNLATFTPYWAYAEAIIRGGTNKGNFIGTYPQPNNATYGRLPYSRADDNVHSTSMEACLTPTGFLNITTPGTALELERDFQVLKRQSTSRPLVASQGPRERVNIALAYLGCAAMMFGSDRKVGRPMFLTAPGEGSASLLSKSNFIWAYHSDPSLNRELRENYNFLSQDYSTNVSFTPQGGVWSMARSEVHFPPSAAPPSIGRTLDDHGYWMFHPGWTGKLRPFSLVNERSPVSPSDMWRDAKKGIMVQGTLLGSQPGLLLQDTLYMQKVMRGFDGTIDGKDVIDGIPK